MSVAEAEAREVQLEAPSGLWSEAWRRLRRNPGAIVGFVLVALFVSVALLAPVIAPYGPLEQGLEGRLRPESPSPSHPFGLDQLGRDVLSRVIFGARFSLLIGVVAVRRRSILLAHILPNSLSPVIVQGTLALATAIIDVAGLGFLGLGPQDPSTPEWGTMLTDTTRFLQTAPYLALIPGSAIVVSVLGFNLIGDGLRETLGIVGESGCGKSVTSLALLGILPRAGRATKGEAIFEGRDLLKMSDDELRRIRGREIAMIFQDPMTSLNPVLTVGRQIREALETHFDMDKKEANRRAGELLDRVGIPSAKLRLKDYPHQFSGGMRQRAMIAMALACKPKLLIADEPTTALDVTIQAQILQLLDELQAEMGIALLSISAGEVEFDGRRIDDADRVTLRAMRRRMQVVFQDPFGSLSPRMTV